MPPPHQLCRSAATKMLRASPLLILLLFLSVAGQSSLSSVQPKLQELDFMLGEWKGTGCMFPVAHSCMKLSQTIKIQRDSAGKGIRFEETLKIKPENDFAQPRPPVTHRALLTFDETSQLWVVNVGKKQVLRGKLIDPKTLQWEQQSELGITRTTIKVSDENEWHHTVESWFGKPKGWVKVIETDLRRSK